MSDSVRDLQRAVQAEPSDPAVIARLEVEVSRMRGEPTCRLLAEEAHGLACCLLDAVSPARRRFRFSPRQVRCTCTARCRTWGWRTGAGSSQHLESRLLATDFAGAVSRFQDRRITAEAERNRAVAERREEQRLLDLAALAARTPRALGWVDAWEARDRAEGRAKERCAPKSMIRLVVEVARREGQSFDEANHEVAKSYRYPVSYTHVSAERLPDSTDVLLTFRRTQTWGNAGDSVARIVIPGDLPIEWPAS